MRTPAPSVALGSTIAVGWIVLAVMVVGSPALAAAALERAQSPLERFDAAEQLRQLGLRDPDPVGQHRRTSPSARETLAGGNVAHHRGPPGEHRSVTDVHVIGESDLSTHDHVVADAGRARDPALRG